MRPGAARGWTGLDSRESRPTTHTRHTARHETRGPRRGRPGVAVPARRSPVVHRAVEAAGHGQVAGLVWEAGAGLLVVLDAQPRHLGGVQHAAVEADPA